jgi:NAD(P)-dependent dehydrogenase (short-subunit alcohol dehydrogenase family)
VEPLGIRVTIVEPGPFRTAFAGRSMRFSTPIADYAGTPAGTTRARFEVEDGNQVGDPAKAAAVIVATIHAESAPLRLVLGERAVTRIRAKLQRQLAELEAGVEVALATTYD